jgi:predicted enzyme related to lactoylglutathione lyase
MAGDVVHVEFPSEDADRAQRFWGGLFGWEFEDSGMPGMDYRMARTSETSGAAVYGSEERTGHPNFYFDTDDIDASAAKVRELGGEAAEKMPVPTHGWLAACKDSEGNAFHLWQSDSSAGS